MAGEQNPDVLAKIEGGQVVAPDAAVAAAEATASAALANPTDPVALQAAKDALATAAPNSTLIGNLDGAIASAQTVATSQAVQAQPATITSNVGNLINAAVQGGVITADQASKLNELAAAQTTVTAPAAEASCTAVAVAGANIPAPAPTFVEQVAGKVGPSTGARGVAA